MKVQITKCSKRGMWYKDLIGKVYELRTIQPETKEGVYIDDKHIIYKGDYEFWNDTDKIIELEQKIARLEQSLPFLNGTLEQAREEALKIAKFISDYNNRCNL